MTCRYEDVVHAVCWNVGRQFGFQAFNMNPLSQNYKKRQFVPATIFVAADHLASLLVKNRLMRQNPNCTDEQRFGRAVWEVHTTIFLNYKTK